MSLLLVIKDDFRVLVSRTLPSGAKGTDATVAAIRGIVQASQDEPSVKRLGQRLGDPDRLYHWLRAAQVFESDPRGVELIRTPAALIRETARHGVFRGDCDDVATLGASLLAAMGQQPAILVMGPEPRESEHRFTHIIFGVQVPKSPSAPDGALWMDPQEGRPIGHRPAEAIKRWYIATGEHAA